MKPPPPPGAPEGDGLLTTAEVAAIFRVDQKTVGKWAQAGLLRTIRTPGRHYRYDAAEVRAIRDGWSRP